MQLMVNLIKFEKVPRNMVLAVRVFIVWRLVSGDEIERLIGVKPGNDSVHGVQESFLYNMHHF